MAIIRNGIFGAISGKIGSVVGSMWKSIATIRGAPKKKTKKQKKKKPMSLAQIANQEKFRFVSQFLVPFHRFINTGYLNLSNEQTEINLAHAATFHDAVLGVHPDLSIDYSKVQISKGKLAPLQDLSGMLVDQRILSLNWTMSYDFGASFDDQLIVAIYCPELHDTDGFIGGTTRAMQKCSFSFKRKFEGKILHVYVGLISLNRKKIANSFYLNIPNPLNHQLL
ncbi:DUF6266 family protein [Pedobacter metabolipauper]|uniref:Uncharacterized protein n=1 Tax=Pedobacter metabolipauper TaxID=425513 RepID=A0A4V6PW16_9SPHI|nr:DUF6266 family protein [Pedobacter metabolipauper]TDQ09977.1 hypothetical protein ATK78_2136 [Pedobacter metabolipauper]